MWVGYGYGYGYGYGRGISGTCEVARVLSSVGDFENRGIFVGSLNLLCS